MQVVMEEEAKNGKQKCIGKKEERVYELDERIKGKNKTKSTMHILLYLHSLLIFLLIFFALPHSRSLSFSLLATHAERTNNRHDLRHCVPAPSFRGQRSRKETDKEAIAL